MRVIDICVHDYNHLNYNCSPQLKSIHNDLNLKMTTEYANSRILKWRQNKILLLCVKTNL